MLTDRQLDIMNILWAEGSATVREAKETLSEDLAYTSVLTLFQTLEENERIRHESEGKAYRYYPTTSRREAAREFEEFLTENGLLSQTNVGKLAGVVLDEYKDGRLRGSNPECGVCNKLDTVLRDL